MKYGWGEKKEMFWSWICFMFGVESRPYCCAAKSMMKEAGASQRAVLWLIPMMADNVG